MARVAALGALLLAGSPGLAARGDDAGASLTPFAWIPTITGTVGLGPLKLPITLRPADLAPGFKAGAMIEAQGPLHGAQIFGELIAIDFAKKDFKPLLGFDVETKLVSVAAGAGLPLHWQRLTLTPLVGFRYSYLATRFTSAQGSGHGDRRWTELRVGGRAGYRLGKGIDVESNYSRALIGPPGNRNHDLVVTGRHRLTRTLSLVGGYRWSTQRMKATASEPLAIDLDGRGPLIGIRLN